MNYISENSGMTTVIDDMPGYNIHANDIIKEEFKIKSEHEDLSENKEFSEETNFESSHYNGQCRNSLIIIY